MGVQGDGDGSGNAAAPARERIPADCGWDDDALFAYALTLSTVDLYHCAAAFGMRAVAADEAGMRQVSIAWWLVRAGRPADAEHRLAAVDDAVHPYVAMIRRTARAMRAPETAEQAVVSLIAELGQASPAPIPLCCLAYAARAAGDRDTEVGAARGMLDQVDGADPQMHGVLAPQRALEGRLAAAVESAEYAATATPADPDAAIRAVARTLDGHGGAAAALFLAEGCRVTGRRVYGDLLTERIPWWVRWRNRMSGFAVSALFLATAVLVGDGRLLWPVAVALFVAAMGATAAAIAVRAPGAGAAATRTITVGYGAHRDRVGDKDVVLPVLGVGGVVFTIAGVVLKGQSHHWTTAGLVTAFTVAVLAAALAVAYATRTRWHARHPPPRHDDTGRCRCWQRDQLTGPDTDTYVTGHLDQEGGAPDLAAVILRCPSTGKLWIWLPDQHLAFAARTATDTAHPEADHAPGYL